MSVIPAMNPEAAEQTTAHSGDRRSHSHAARNGKADPPGRRRGRDRARWRRGIELSSHPAIRCAADRFADAGHGRLRTACSIAPSCPPSHRPPRIIAISGEYEASVLHGQPVQFLPKPFSLSGTSGHDRRKAELGVDHPTWTKSSTLFKSLMLCGVTFTLADSPLTSEG